MAASATGPQSLMRPHCTPVLLAGCWIVHGPEALTSSKTLKRLGHYGQQCNIPVTVQMTGREHDDRGRTHTAPAGWTSVPVVFPAAWRALTSLLRLASRSAWRACRCPHAPSRRVSHESRMTRANAAALPPTIAAEMQFLAKPAVLRLTRGEVWCCQKAAAGADWCI